jgi:hypothetical protein
VTRLFQLKLDQTAFIFLLIEQVKTKGLHYGQTQHFLVFPLWDLARYPSLEHCHLIDYAEVCLGFDRGHHVYALNIGCALFGVLYL